MADAKPIHSYQAPQGFSYPFEHAAAQVSNPDCRVLRITSQRSDLLQWSSCDSGWQSLRVTGAARTLRVSRGGVYFLLSKLAETVIPITLLTVSDECCRISSGAVSRFESTGTRLCVSASGFERSIYIPAFRDAWLVARPCASGGFYTLELFDDTEQPIASIGGQRRQCIAWRALTQWLVLRESRLPNRRADLPRTQGEAHGRH